jgi:hypothetical protein
MIIKYNMAKSTKSQHKMEKVMHEFKEGTLKSGRNGIGGKVKSRLLFIYGHLSTTSAAPG